MTKEEILKHVSGELSESLKPDELMEWLSSALDQLEQGTAQKFDTFKVTEYPNYSDFKDTRQAYIAGEMHIMIEIKQLIDKLKTQ